MELWQTKPKFFIFNSLYNFLSVSYCSNVGNFKQHMKTHDNEELREQRNAILSEMIATCFNPQTSLYTCHVCNSNYNHSGNFKQHLLKHERESGSISATLVAQAGANPHLTNVLQSAMADRVDSGDKPAINQYQYQCEHCDRSFKHPGIVGWMYTVCWDDFKQNRKNFQQDVYRIKEFFQRFQICVSQNPGCKDMESNK